MIFSPSPPPIPFLNLTTSMSSLSDSYYAEIEKYYSVDCSDSDKYSVYHIVPDVSIKYRGNPAGFFFNLKSKSSDSIFISFAILDDQDGLRLHFEFASFPSYDSLSEILSDFGIDTSIHFNVHSYNHLISSGYHIHFYDKYHHFVIASDFLSFELESKGVSGGLFHWSNNPAFRGSSVHNISDSGDHMWNDNYRIRCDCDSD